jgi:hypothetical protein
MVPVSLQITIKIKIAKPILPPNKNFSRLIPVLAGIGPF